MKNFLLLKNILRILYALDLTFISFAKQIPLCETFAISTIFSVSTALLQLISASFGLFTNYAGYGDNKTLPVF